MVAAQEKLNQLESTFSTDVESLFIHTNKDKFAVGEYLWFKAYAFNLSKNTPNNEAISAEVNVFDEKRVLISSKKYIVTNGVFAGEFKIDTTFIDGTYYLQAHTDYMKKQGFDSHTKAFQVLKLPFEKEDDYASSQLNLQILPEGGHAVYGIDNTIGIKLINANGLGEVFSAELLKDGKAIKKIKSNSFGHAKFKLKPKKKATYSVQVMTDNDVSYTKEIQDIHQSGITLQLNPLIPDVLYVELQKNYKKDQSRYALIIHQFQKGIKIDAEFEDDISKLAIPKEKLFEGMNTIRVFKDGEPILERLYFKNTDDVFTFEGQITESKDEVKDSIRLKLYFPYDPSQKMLSASILPSKTESYSNKSTIISNLRLANYLRGTIENEAYYFGENTAQRNYDLDLLLLTQGWSKYKWKPAISKENLVNANRRNGLNFKVLLDEKPKSTDEFLLFHGSIFNEAKVVYINKKTTEAEFLNMYPVIGEKLKFSYVNKSQSYKAPELSLELQDFTIDTILSGNLPLLQILKDTGTLNMNNASEAFINTDVLDEVIVKGVKTPEKNIAKTGGSGRYYAIDDQTIQTTRNLAFFLNKRGFIAYDYNGSLTISSTRSSAANAGPVTVVLDGVELMDFSFLAGSKISQFESVIINKDGIGTRFPGGVIYLESRKSSFLGDTSNSMFTEIKVENGYDSTKEFYNPVYINYDDAFFKKYGTISWAPQILIGEDNQILELVFKNPNMDYTLFVEGVGSDGKLYSYQIDQKVN